MQNNIINITSTSNETIKYFISLNDKKTRMNAKRFIVEGYHLVNEASKTNLLEAIISTDEKELKKINNVKRYLVNDAIINKIATTKNPQNILGIVKMLDHNITNLVPIIKENKTKLIMLDDVLLLCITFINPSKPFAIPPVFVPFSGTIPLFFFLSQKQSSIVVSLKPVDTIRILLLWSIAISVPIATTAKVCPVSFALFPQKDTTAILYSSFYLSTCFFYSIRVSTYILSPFHK